MTTARLLPPFVERYGPWAIVAGASEGIGAAFSRALAARGLNLFLIARRRDELVQFAASLSLAHPGVDVVPIALDLGAADAANVLAEHIAHADVGLLVYNACSSRIGGFCCSPAEKLDEIVDTNCRGAIRVAHMMAPRLAARGRGGILLMSSLSGFHGLALGAAYAASKAFTTVLGACVLPLAARECARARERASVATPSPCCPLPPHRRGTVGGARAYGCRRARVRGGCHPHTQLHVSYG